MPHVARDIGRELAEHRLERVVIPATRQVVDLRDEDRVRRIAERDRLRQRDRLEQRIGNGHLRHTRAPRGQEQDDTD